MVICAVVGCSKRTDRDREFSFFRFPAVKNNCTDHLKKLQKIRRLLWILRINRRDFTDVQANYARVCSRHFISGKPCHVKDRNNPDWAPSLNLGYKKIKNVDTVIARYKSCSFDEIPTENIVSDFNSTSSYQEFINEEAEQVDGNSCSFDEVTTENIMSDFNSTSSYQEFINEEVEQVEENSYSFDEVTTENIIVPDFSSTSSCQEFINEEAVQVEENSSHEFFSEDNISTDSNIDSPPPQHLDDFENIYAEESLENA